MDGSVKCTMCDGGTIEVRASGRPQLDGTYPTRTERCPVCGGAGVIIDDATAAAAQETLQDAIRAYQATMNPGEHVDGWVLVTQRTSDALDAAGISVTGTLQQQRQAHALTVGMLTIALDGERR
jgi:hypothetical protein